MTGNSTALSRAMDMLWEAGTGMVEDAMNMAGLQGGLGGVRPTRGLEGARVVGLAATALFAPQSPDMPRLNNFRVISESPPGSVLVIDGKGMDCHFTGDNQGAYAKARGLQAVVIYGGARDVDGYREIGVPLYCMGSATRSARLTHQLVAHGVPIEVGGITVRPGDIVVTDGDGVAVVPIEVLETVLANIKIVQEVEEGIKSAIKSGAPIDEIEAILGRKSPRRGL